MNASGPPASDYIESRRIGEATVSVISEGEFLDFSLVDWFRPTEAELRRAVGRPRFGMNLAHVRIGDASILVDAGLGDPPPGAPDRFGGWRVRRSPGLGAVLAAIGVAPHRVTHVLLTHHHPDHIAGATVERDGHRVARFPNARHVIGAADWAGTPARDLMSPDAEAELATLEGLEDAASGARRGQLGVAVQLGVLERLGLLDLTAGDQEIVPGVTLVHAPGESPGHAIVRVESARERFYFLGDLLHHPFEIDHPDWVPAGRDPVATRAARERLFADAAASGAALLCAHRPFPGWIRIRREGTRYRWVDG